MTAEMVLEARSLRKYFPTGASKMLQRPTAMVQAVDDVSFGLERGTTLAVVGESGCGKSTLGRLLARLIEPTAGSVLLDGVDVTAASPRELLALRRDVQVVFQDPYACLNPRHSIGQSIGTPIRIQKTLSRSAEKDRVRELMQLVGLNPEHYNRFPHEFSGGQRQRAGIAGGAVSVVIGLAGYWGGMSQAMSPSLLALVLLLGGYAGTRTLSVWVDRMLKPRE